MLTVLRRVFSFSDWNSTHPREPPPGDMLDASFDAQNQRIAEIEALVESVRRPDGQLQNGIVTRDTLHPDVYGDLRYEMRFAAAGEALKSEEFTKRAEKAAISSENSVLNAIDAENQARAFANELSSARSAQISQLQAILSETQRLLAELGAKTTDLLEVEQYAGYSEAWAEASALWAEHMPDTLPDNALKVMDVTGDHWSAKWWANRADNAFGRLTDLYLGAWPEPPLTNLEGGPITIGSIYYDTDPPPGQMYVWDGSNWQSMTSPQRAMTATLWYSAVSGQTVFPLTTPDIYGHTYGRVDEALIVYANGVKLMPYLSPLGDWTVSGSTVTLQRPVRSDDLISFDIFMPDTALGPGAVETWSLAPISGKDGVKVSFALATKAAPGVPVTITKSEELLVSLDGAIQEPGVSYTASGATITFAQAPTADAYTFITWFRPV